MAWTLEGKSGAIGITMNLYSRVLPNMQDELAVTVANLLKRGGDDD